MMYWTVATSIPPIEGGREYDQFRDNFSEPLLLAWFNEEGKVSKTFQYGYYDHKIRQYLGLEDHREFHPTHWAYQKDFLEYIQSVPKFNPEDALPFKKSGLLTTRLIVDIEDLIVGPTRNCREVLFVPNVSWGFFREHEADLVQISRSGFMTEYEIKRSWSDFIADFKKKSYHADDRISELYYVVPEVMAQQAADYICPDEKSKWAAYHAGVLGFDENLCRLKTYLACSYPKGKKLYLEDQYEIARLGVLRYWAMRRSLK